MFQKFTGYFPTIGSAWCFLESDWIQSDSKKSSTQWYEAKPFDEYSILKCCWYITTWDVFNMPRKINLEPENHLFKKENHLPNLHYCVPLPTSGQKNPGILAIPTNPPDSFESTASGNQQTTTTSWPADFGFQVSGGISWDFIWCGWLLSWIWDHLSILASCIFGYSFVEAKATET